MPVAALESKPLSPPYRLIAVSRLAPNKRIEHAVRALKILRAQQIDAQLTIVGSGESKQSLISMVGQLGLGESVTFTGSLSEADKNRQLQQAHCLVHTSIREGWGLNVIEANALGTPAVVYPVGGLVDSTVDGVTGKVVAQESPESLAKELSMLFGQPELYQKLRENAWRRSFEFSWKVICPVAADWLEALAKRDTK